MTFLETIAAATGEPIRVDRRPKLNERIQHHIVRSEMTEIAAIYAREILDSRGNPTVEADVVLEGGAHGAGSRAERRIDRRARGSGAARRRQEPLSGQGRAEGGREHREHSGAGADGHGRFESAAAGRDDDFARRLREQRAHRRECDSGGVDGRGEGFGGGAESAAVPVPGRGECFDSADAR